MTDSFIQQEEEIINRKTEEIIEFFKKKGFDSGTQISENMWFFKDINQDQTHILWQVLSAPDNDLTISEFVHRLVEKAKQIHLFIVDLQINADYSKEDQMNYNKYLKIMESSNQQKFSIFLDAKEYKEENALVISYVEKNNQLSEIYKFYRLKYKVGTVLQNYQSLYPENSNRSTCVTIDSSVKFITIVIMGKRLEMKQLLGDDHKEISQVEVPLTDIYASVKPRHFALVTIPQTYLAVTYSDQTQDAPYTEDVQLSLRFDVRLGYEGRQLVVQKLQKENESQIKGIDVKLNEKIKLMNQLLSPFKEDPKLQYVPARGIGLPQDFPAQQKKIIDKDKDKDQIKPRETCSVYQIAQLVQPVRNPYWPCYGVENFVKPDHQAVISELYQKAVNVLTTDNIKLVEKEYQNDLNKNKDDLMNITFYQDIEWGLLERLISIRKQLDENNYKLIFQQQPQNYLQIGTLEIYGLKPYRHKNGYISDYEFNQENQKIYFNVKQQTNQHKNSLLDKITQPLIEKIESNQKKNDTIFSKLKSAINKINHSVAKNEQVDLKSQYDQFRNKVIKPSKDKHILVRDFELEFDKQILIQNQLGQVLQDDQWIQKENIKYQNQSIFIRTEALIESKESPVTFRAKRQVLTDINFIMRGNPWVWVKKYDIEEQ
ncbi:hypothetical protein pb186bvf_001583 [Paramecium bursaria]